MRTKIVSAVAALMLLAACESTPATTGGTGGTGVVPGTQEDLVVNVGDRVFFGYDRFDLTPEARTTLQRQSAWLARFPNVQFLVEGHADERGTREYNLALAERRANSARDYLIAQGVAGARVATTSFGKERPAVLGSNEAAWAQNRRAVSTVR